ncbi:peptidyl-prolyl cis-trans isomerase [Flavobacteriaceae bacterium R38]|nr:peptidyl-prolyl cis-trans isomerase [Flavobacteriaceae bacterium R38]
MLKKIYYTSIFLLLVSCNLFQKQNETDKKVVARVGENYLYEEDIKEILNERLSKEDSAIIVNNYINTWAKKQLLVEKARINLDEKKTEEFEELIEDYRLDLYTAAYKEALVNREMDTVVSLEEMNVYYLDNKENFKLNEDLIKLRYVQLNSGFSDVELVKERLARFDEDDKRELQDMSLQFNSYSLNDSVWIKSLQFIQKIPVINAENKKRYLKKSQFFELTDSLEVYLVQVSDILNRNDNAPLEYIKPTLRQIILNKRKLEFIRNLEKDLIDEAVQKKQFEVYEKN